MGGGVIYWDKDGGVIYRGDVCGGGDIVDVAMDVSDVCWRLSLECQEDGSSCGSVGGV